MGVFCCIGYLIFVCVCSQKYWPLKNTKVQLRLWKLLPNSVTQMFQQPWHFSQVCLYVMSVWMGFQIRSTMQPKTASNLVPSCLSLPSAWATGYRHMPSCLASWLVFSQLELYVNRNFSWENSSIGLPMSKSGMHFLTKGWYVRVQSTGWCPPMGRKTWAV